MSSIRLVSEKSYAAGPADKRRIDELAALLSQLTSGLASLQEEIRLSLEQIPPALSDLPAGLDVRVDVRNARKLRHLRKIMFGGDLHWGPAWDILLHLYESHVLQRSDTIGTVTVGTELPGATTLRWIGRLEQDGLIEVRDDHLDRRRRYVELSACGIERMSQYFSGAAPHLVAA